MSLTSLTNLQPNNIKVTGIATFDQTVGIAGTLTYEDVTNIDAVGIVTARSGVNVSGGQLDVGSNIKIGNAGVITATSFVGSGALLTSLPAQATISNNADNRVITGGSGVNLNGEANLTFDGSTLDIFNGSNSSTIKLKRHASTASQQAHIGYFSSGLHIETREATYIALKTNTSERLRITSAGAIQCKGETDVQNSIFRVTDGTPRIIMSVPSGGLDTRLFNDGSGNFIIGHGTNSDAPTERLRIKSNGYMGVGNFSSKPTAITDPLNVDSGIGTCNIGGNYIHLKRYSGGNTQYINAPQNNANLHISADDHIAFGVDHSSSMYSMGTEALRIDSSGRVIIGDVDNANAHANADDLIIGNTGNDQRSGITIVSDTDKDGAIHFSDGTGSGQLRGQIVYGHSFGSYSDVLAIYTAGSSSMLIQEDGDVVLGEIGSTRYTEGSTSAQLRVVGNASASRPGAISLMGFGNTTNTAHARINFQQQTSGTNGQTTARIEAISVGGAEDASDLAFHTEAVGGSLAEKLRIESGGTIRTINGVQSGGNATGGLKFTSNYSGKGFDIAAQYATQGNGGSGGGDPMFSGWWGSQNTFRVNTSGQIKFGASLNGQVQSGSFSVPAGGTKTITVSGMVSGAYMFQGGTYSSSGQGQGGIHFTDSGYHTATYTHDIHEIFRWSNGGGSGISISGVSKNSSSSSFTVSNSHGSFNAGFNWHIWGNDEVVVTIS